MTPLCNKKVFLNKKIEITEWGIYKWKCVVRKYEEHKMTF